MIYGSICSGIEAATVAWRALGWHAAFFSEIDTFPCALLAHRYKALGNSMAVPVIRWLGERMAMVDSLASETAA